MDDGCFDLRGRRDFGCSSTQASSLPGLVITSSSRDRDLGRHTGNRFPQHPVKRVRKSGRSQPIIDLCRKAW